MAQPILPLSGRTSPSYSSRPGPLGLDEGFDTGFGMRNDNGLPMMLRRLTKFKSMDFELAFWQLGWLAVSPRRVYKQTYHHKQTKNVWARDDPAMIVLIAGLVIFTGLAWSLVLAESIPGTIYIILKMLFRDFLLSCLTISTLLYFLTNKLLLSPTSTHLASTENRVEYTYAFDVAVNSFFPLFCITHVVLLGLSKVVVRDNWICLFFGNTLFLIAGVQYVYITYLGYAALPFVVRSELLLTPLLPIFGGYLLSLLGFNVARHTLELYFGVPWR